PDVDAIHGLQSVIGIAQETTNSQNMRSTIGTLTDIYSFLRLFFARASDAYSYVNGHKMVQQSVDQIESQLLDQFASQTIIILAPLVQGRKGHYRELFAQLYKKNFSQVRINGVITPIVPQMYLDRYKIHNIELVIEKIEVSHNRRKYLKEALDQALYHGKGKLLVQAVRSGQVHYYSRFLMDPTTGISYASPSPNTFSFNSQYGACEQCKGFGQVSMRNIHALIPDKNLSVKEGAIIPLGPYKKTKVFATIESFLTMRGYSMDAPLSTLPEELIEEILYGSDANKEMGPNIVEKLAKLAGKSTKEIVEQYQTCPSCDGTRLQKQSLHFKIYDKNIAELSRMNLEDLYNWFKLLPKHLTDRQKKIGREIIKEIKRKLSILLEMGLHYLNLDRSLQTLSGGEIRRIRLATQIGTQENHLVGVMYILDEPSIGLHQRDNEKLLKALKQLRDLGNTVLVIEHDRETMLASDYIIEVGPGPGEHGGKIIAFGAPKDFLKKSSVTADYLLNKKEIALPTQRRKGNKHSIQLVGCTGHNLQKISVNLPLGKLIVITGVSGSGKSTLVNQTLLPILKRKINYSVVQPLPYEKVSGTEHIDKVIEIDQAPIGRTSRSNPATYTGIFTLIRNFFVQLPQSKIRGYKPGRFSFNVKGGSCHQCKGAGVQTIEMDFLPSMHVSCETCRGRRYNRETLEVHYKGKSIADILEMTVDKALSFFEHHPQIARKIETLADVGLAYITLGQLATTLSGGEAQRVKLATELSKKSTGKTLYILDEPTTGLHFQDIAKLLDIINKLADKGNTVIIIEHNLDVIKIADHIIDLGPEAGEGGGHIVAEGTPEEVAHVAGSYTGHFLAKEIGIMLNK
ncbi:MAG: excinuclease ABC subunit UvrA, partial [Bacteroidota bacterium]